MRASRIVRLASAFVLLVFLFHSRGFGQIAVTAGSAFTSSSGASGRLGSTTGLLTDGPSTATGTTGLVANGSHILGGPVPPGDPLNLFPGTTCVTEASHSSSMHFQGGTAFMVVDGHCASNASLTNMDGAGLSANAGANGNFDYTFTISTNTPYKLSGIAAIDNEDASGSIRMFRGIIPMHGVFNTANGPFEFSGTLTPATYRVLGNTSVYCAAGAGANGVGFSGNFSESSTVISTLVVGCVGIVEQPQNAETCAGGGASFAVAANGTAALAYQWEIETSPGIWTALDVVPTALPCGGMASAASPTAATTQVSVTPCAGVSQYAVRCVVTNSCGSATSAAAVLTVHPAGSGDGNVSGTTDGLDIQQFVEILIGGGVPGAGYCACDMTGNGVVDSADLPGFVSLLTAP